MNPLPSLDSPSTYSDVFYVERSSKEGSLALTNTPAVLNLTQTSAAMARETITIFSTASLAPQTVTIDSDSNEPTTPHGFGNQHPIFPPSLNELNLSPNPFNVCGGYYGRDSTIRRIQPPITRAVYPVTNLYAPNEFEYH